MHLHRLSVSAYVQLKFLVSFYVCSILDIGFEGLNTSETIEREESENPYSFEIVELSANGAFFRPLDVTIEIETDGAGCFYIVLYVYTYKEFLQIQMTISYYHKIQ